MIKATADIDRLIKLMPKIAKKVTYAESEALNQTANIAARAQRTQAESTFDRPTPYLLNGIYNPTRTLGFVGIFSKASTLRAELIPGGPRGNFTAAGLRINDIVRLQSMGGTRTPAKRALPVPTSKARLNKYGNLSSGYIKTLLAKPNHVQLGERQGLPDGIYRREVDGRLSLIVAWEPRTGYRPIFNYHRIAEGVFTNNFAKQFDQAFEKEMANLK